MEHINNKLTLKYYWNTADTYVRYQTSRKNLTYKNNLNTESKQIFAWKHSWSVRIENYGINIIVKKQALSAEVGRPLFWSAAKQTTEIIADQRTGKNSGPALADQR